MSKRSCRILRHMDALSPYPWRVVRSLVVSVLSGCSVRVARSGVQVSVPRVVAAPARLCLTAPQYPVLAPFKVRHSAKRRGMDLTMFSICSALFSFTHRIAFATRILKASHFSKVPGSVSPKRSFGTDQAFSIGFETALRHAKNASGDVRHRMLCPPTLGVWSKTWHGGHLRQVKKIMSHPATYGCSVPPPLACGSVLSGVGP